MGQENKPDHGFIGISQAMLDVYKTIEKVSKTETPVFILGESGTGKELCAQTIHAHSNRRAGLFIPVNCANLSTDRLESELFGHVKGAYTGADKDRKGAVECAKGGTLFLDEICEMPMEIQAKLLRFTQDFKYQKLGCDKWHTANIRIICATNKNPQEQTDLNLFRDDLFHRLHVVPITMPPLRERAGDITDVAFSYLKQYTNIHQKNFEGFSQNVEKIFQSYSWPGNIRELKNVIRKIVTLNDGQFITTDMLPDDIIELKKPVTRSSDHHNIFLPLWQIEKHAIEKAIIFCDGNIPKAAAILDIAPSTIYRKIQSWDEKQTASLKT